MTMVFHTRKDSRFRGIAQLQMKETLENVVLAIETMYEPHKIHMRTTISSSSKMIFPSASKMKSIDIR